jgi:cyclohexyl-isocyanide hydratase
VLLVRPCSRQCFRCDSRDARIVIDRNRASGGGVTSGSDFALAMIGEWHGVETGRLTELLIEYAPQPPFGV